MPATGRRRRPGGAALHTQLTAERAALDARIAAHTAALTGTLVVIDTRPGPPEESYGVSLWDIDDASAVPG